MAAVQEKKNLVEQCWLNYFNRVLYEKGLITENEKNRMAVRIACHKATDKNY